MRLGMTCAECGRPSDITMLCAVCRMLPEYGGPGDAPLPIEDDCCGCAACRSDVAGLVPCLKESGDGR